MMNKLHLLDCMEGMAQFPDNYFELAIVDPPYGIGADKMQMGSGKNRGWSKGKNWDNLKPDKEYFQELFRVSKNQIIWGGNYFTDIIPPSENYILWDKLNPNMSFSEGELAWVNNGNKIRIYKKYSANIVKIHPTQKPIQLYRWLLQNYAKQGDKILDTHVGSGSSIIACILEHYEYCGFEIDADYHRDATKRIETERQQLKLF